MVEPGNEGYRDSNKVKEFLVGDNADVVAQQQDGAVHEAPTTDEDSNLPHDPYANVPPSDDDEDVPF